MPREERDETAEPYYISALLPALALKLGGSFERQAVGGGSLGIGRAQNPSLRTRMHPAHHRPALKGFAFLLPAFSQALSGQSSMALNSELPLTIQTRGLFLQQITDTRAEISRMNVDGVERAKNGSLGQSRNVESSASQRRASSAVPPK